MLKLTGPVLYPGIAAPVPPVVFCKIEDLNYNTGLGDNKQFNLPLQWHSYQSVRIAAGRLWVQYLDRVIYVPNTLQWYWTFSCKMLNIKRIQSRLVGQVLV